ncbi:hypothetical protein GE09DRAFT_1218091 [Coniochaeta sp. 2T2.1]|nr:hypothetical protein GE09DRAFT_1218091 [Coniochaeta sp. 2T2.1]
MKSTILTVLSLASSTAARGSIEFCPTSPAIDKSYGCATYTFDNNPGPCWALPTAHLHGKAHYVGLSTGLRCLLYDNDQCTGQAIAEVISRVTPTHHDRAVSAVYCFDYDNDYVN